MSSFGMILIGSILGLAINVGLVYYFVNFTKRDTKSTALSVILSLIFGPLIGYSYARPKAWGTGLAAELVFFAPLGVAAGLLIQGGSVGIGGAIVAYLVIAAAVPAVLMTQDQNEQFGGHESLT